MSHPRISSRRLAVSITAVLTAFLSSLSTASTPTTFPDAAASDPATLGWMMGSPPPADRTLRFEDGSYYQFPAMRWSVSNFRQLMPTINVSRGLGAPVPLQSALRSDIDALGFVPLGAKASMTWEQSLAATYTDGIVVMHRGKVVYERYFGVLKPEGQHAAMSVTKSVVGTLGAMLVAEGRIDADKHVADYVPELANSAFGSATVRQVLDMTTALKYSEDYADPNAEVWAHAKAGSPLPKPKDYTGPRSYYEFLQTVQLQGEHGSAFAYKTVNSDVLGWVIARVTGRNVAQLLSERIWSRLGAEQDAYFTVDSIGTPFAGGGLNTGLRDLARFGEMLRNDGAFNGQQIVPKAVVDDIRHGSDKQAFAKAGYDLLKGWSYRSMWWVTNKEGGAFMARGVHGQRIYVDPKAEMVIVRYASHPVAANSANDPVTLPAFEALAQHLSRLH
ncbi:serine hydrolase domain-containing protein [Pseudomonas fluorescens]|jgi:CubicO group peptidase (beta-lactamase class C family)|uniref:6-aminohexanoate-dimer hydrolase n=1 Tax=Pseudomonas fluorescens TaxID=294 RepID=A0A5E7RJW4_PSEFL|nr:serine hydrolase [Pseudomonas fluorescens]VVP74234.1 6-aminohexanoate-dimer hydrolase [Pseudomonas fluorescens]